jgi:23S rRNA (cytidine2498-2'-O)-methyltransferase
MAEDSFPLAKEEMRRHVPDLVEVRRVGAEAAIVETEATTARDLAALVRRKPMLFTRHVTNVVAEFDPAVSDLASVIDALDAALRETTGEPAISLQLWASGKVHYEFNRHEAWQRAAQLLGDRGYQVSRAGDPVAVSICYTPKTAIVGVNRVEDSLSSWPGGEIRLSRSPEQVSRAEFKLEELFKNYELPEDLGGYALDFGAAPGGWTRILAGLGFRTTAVDPGDLDPRVLRLPGVRHERTTAGNFIRNSRESFDLIVNDMKMSPTRSSRLMVDSLPLLAFGGIAITTLKTGDRGVLPQIEQSFAILHEGYDIEFARQLRHNRNEVTVVLRSRRR